MGRNSLKPLELVVVIGVLAFLLAIVIPSLGARDRGAAVVCLTNQRNLTQSYLLYVEDNSGKIPGGYISGTTMYDSLPGGNQDYPPIWVWPPVYADLSYAGTRDGDRPTLEDRYSGCRGGALWPYNETVKLYHCPADKQYVQASPCNRYRSYSIHRGLAVYSRQNDITNFNEITSPAEKYVFVEESYDLLANFNYNHGSWDFAPWQGDFHDPLALFHTHSSIFGFADGHAQRYLWKDERTVAFFTDRAAYSPGSDALCAGNVDLAWLQKGFAYNDSYYGPIIYR